MVDIAEQVRAWRAAGMPVVVARIVQTRGISSRDGGAVAAFAAGAPPAGSLLSGAADDQLAALAVAGAERAIVEVAVSDQAAAAAGLSCGGTARVLLQPAAEVPEEAWTRLQTREPVCLVTELADGSVGKTAAFTPATVADADARYGEPVARLFARGASVTRLLGDQPTLLVTALWPRPTLVVVGDGLIADALAATASLLGWQFQVVNDAGAAAAAVGGSSSADAVVVLSHDRTVDGPSLRAALAGRAGYVGALGSRNTQAARASWLTEHDVPAAEIGRIHGPAGLDIGANSPGEIAVSIAAEILAARAGAPAGSLRNRLGPVHLDGVHAPPPRYPLRQPM